MVGWYIGAGINLVGSIAINLGTNVMKLGHNKRAALDLPEAEKPPVKKIREWQIGVALFAVGNIANFISFGYAAQSLLAALGCIQFVSNVAFAYWVLKEKVTIVVVAATACIVSGCILLVVFGNHDSQPYNVKLLMELYTRLPYLLYLLVSAVTVVVMYLVYRTGYRKMKSQQGFSRRWMMVLPVAYALFSGLIGTQSVLLSKSLSVLLRETFSGNNQLTAWFTYVVLPLFLATAAFWVTRLNKGLRMFPAMVIVPTMQISWTLFSITSGMLYFEEYSAFTPLSGCMFGLGVVVVFAGVFLLTKSQGPVKKAGYERMEEEALKAKTVEEGGEAGEGLTAAASISAELLSPGARGHQSHIQLQVVATATLHGVQPPSSTALPPVNPARVGAAAPLAGPPSLTPNSSWSSTALLEGHGPEGPHPPAAAGERGPIARELELVQSVGSCRSVASSGTPQQRHAAEGDVAGDLISFGNSPRGSPAAAAGRRFVEGIRSIPAELGLGLDDGSAARSSLGLGGGGMLPAISLFAVPAVDLSGSWSLSGEKGVQVLSEMEAAAEEMYRQEAQQAQHPGAPRHPSEGVQWHSNSTFHEPRSPATTSSAALHSPAHPSRAAVKSKYLEFSQVMGDEHSPTTQHGAALAPIGRAGPPPLASPLAPPPSHHAPSSLVSGMQRAPLTSPKPRAINPHPELHTPAAEDPEAGLLAHPGRAGGQPVAEAALKSPYPDQQQAAVHQRRQEASRDTRSSPEAPAALHARPLAAIR